MYKALTYILAFVTMLTIVGFMGQLWWVFDLASHFRPQYFIALVILVVLFAKAKKWKSTGVGIICGLANFMLISPYIGTINSVTEIDKPKIRILSMNLNHTNSSYKKAELIIKKTQPNVLILQELSNSWESALGETLSKFPYFEKLPVNSTYGLDFPIPKFLLPLVIPKEKLFIGLFSHLPFERIITGRPDSYIRGRFKFKENIFTLFGVHLTSPIGKSSS